MRYLVLFCIVLLAGFTSFPQKYSFVTYSNEEGLPQSQVTAISQGPDGYLWVGTLGGLAKFNGKEFVPFSTQHGLWNNRIKTISNFDDRLWVGHDGGISIIKNNKIKSYGFVGVDQSRHVSGILKFKERILVCTTQGGLFEFKNNKLITIEEDNEDIDRIRSAYVWDGELYLATRSGVLKTSDLKSFNVLEPMGTASFRGVTGDENQMIFAKRFGEVIRMNLETKQKEVYDLDTMLITGCYLDRDDQIWVSTDAGVVRINKNGEKLHLDEKKGLPVNITSCFFQDNSSNIWIGSEGKGVFRFPGISFQYFDQSTGFPTDLFLNGLQKPNGDFYYGTFEKGIVKKDRFGTIKTIETGEEYIWASVQGVDGKDWYGSESNLLAIDSDENIEYYYRDDGVPGIKVGSFHKIDDVHWRKRGSSAV